MVPFTSSEGHSIFIGVRGIPHQIAEHLLRQGKELVVIPWACIPQGWLNAGLRPAGRRVEMHNALFNALRANICDPFRGLNPRHYWPDPEGGADIRRVNG